MKVRGRAKAAPDASNRTRLLVVNSHPVTRIGLAHLINDQPDLVVCDEAGDAAEALETLKKTGRILCFRNLNCPTKSGLELIKDIKAMRPALPVLVISMHDESLYAERALRGREPKGPGCRFNHSSSRVSSSFG